MHKEEKSSRHAVEFPAKCWDLEIKLQGMSKEMIPLGRLNLVETEDPIKPYVGAILFYDDPQFRDVKDKPFPVDIISFDHHTGAIEFHILGATALFNPGTPAQYRFVFTGIYERNEHGEMWLHGRGGVPRGFCSQFEAPGKRDFALPGDDGEDVIWRSGGPTDPSRKRSK